MLTLPQTTAKLHNDNGEICGSAGATGQTTIMQAFSQSCDTTFGNLGMDLGGGALKTTADEFGMNDANLNIPGVTVAPSQYLLPDSLANTAFSAIGQFSDTVIAAAGGDVLGRDRQRRHADEAVPHPAGHRL